MRDGVLWDTICSPVRQRHDSALESIRWTSFVSTSAIRAADMLLFIVSRWDLVGRRRSGWNSGGRMTSAEGGSVPSGVGYGEVCPLRSRLEGLGERRELPQRGPWQNPGPKRTLAYFEVHKTLLFVPIWQNLREIICISVPYSKFWGTCPRPTRDLRPCAILSAVKSAYWLPRCHGAIK